MFQRSSGWAAVAVLGWVSLVPPGPARAGTGLSFLKIGAGARSVALGNAVVSHVDDASATYWNPGAMPLREGWRAELTHNSTFEGVRYEFASIANTYGPHALGLSFHGIWTERMGSYDASGEYRGDFGYYGVALAGAYGVSLADRLGLGVAVSYLREAIDISSADGVSLNLGVQARELLPHTDLGVSVLHLGSQMQYVEQSFDLPTTVQGGVTLRLPLRSISGALLFAAEARKIRDEEGQLLFGTEYSYQNLARLSVGYRTGLDTEDVSLGFGVGDGRIRGQYAYVPFGENLGEQHRIGIELRQ